MTSLTYSLRIYNEINDPELVHNWKRLENNSDCHPQVYYEWCEPWWREYSMGRELHIVAVFDQKRKLVGIAPLCIENILGLKILRSIPIRFGDFYSFIIDSNIDKFRIISEILLYLKSFKKWHIVQLTQVNKNNILWNRLNDTGFKAKFLCKIHIVEIENVIFEKYLEILPKKLRQQYHNRLRRISKIGEIKFEYIDNVLDYLKYFHEMKNIYYYRWINNRRKSPSDKYYSVQKDAIHGLFNSRNFLLLVLKLNNEIIAYRLGAVKNGIYYAWKVSHNPEYNSYSPGILLIGKIIEKLIQRKYKQINFGAGDYDWKRRWATPEMESANYEFIIGRKNSIPVRFYIKYRIKWREKFIRLYFIVSKISLIRTLSRRILPRK
jgi:CelD/BcsL family acetyltransferase involved in cellulose biosynthesis